jgi:ribosomal-protein-alanine N-acetyltransferase
MTFLIRKVVAKDLPAVWAVESAAKAEITLEYLERELHNPLSRFYLTEETDTDTVVAYLLAWQIDETDVEIHHLASHPDWQRRGLGAQLIRHLIEEHRPQLGRLFLEVRAGNASAIGFYESLGFVCCGVRTGYYRNPEEDARLYQYNISRDR